MPLSLWNLQPGPNDDPMHTRGALPGRACEAKSEQYKECAIRGAERMRYESTGGERHDGVVGRFLRAEHSW